MITLKSNREFKEIYKSGKNFWNRNFILFVKKNNLEYSRVGFSVTKKIGNSVVRNKIKRRMKEIIRLISSEIKVGYDFILIPKKNVLDMSYKDVDNALIHILNLAHLLKR